MFRAIGVASAFVAIVAALIVLLLGVADLAGAQEQEPLDPCFVATAYNYYGESDFSEEACAVPEILDVGQGWTLEWNAVYNATGYKLYWRDAQEPADGTYKFVVDVGNNLTKFISACDLYCLDAKPALSIIKQGDP